MRVICISDLHQKFHIDDEEQQKMEKFYSFLDYLILDHPDKLIVAGDMFDVWLEYKMVIPKAYFTTLHKLKLLADKGTKIIYLAGNHDFVFRDFFQKILDAKVCKNDYTVIINDKKFFISHGDSYTTNDAQYHLLRGILRNSLVLKLFGWLHPDIGLSTGKIMSRSSKNRNKSKKTLDKQEKGLIGFSEQLFNKGYDYTVMGHIHNPRIITLEKGSYINLGDWIQHHSYLEIIDDSIELKYWE